MRLAGAVAVLAAGAGLFHWWNRPERRIEALLAEVASVLTYDAGGTGLGALAEVAGLQALLSASVVVELEPPSPPLRGRQEVMATLARIRTSVPMMRVQFFDAEIAVASPTAATSRVTVQVTTRDPDGRELADARLLALAFVEQAGRWTIAEARALPRGAP